MINYLMINIILSASALAINHWLDIPHRIRFYGLMVAVIAWLIPFGLMTFEISQQSAANLPIKVIELSQPISSVSQNIEKPFDFSVLIALMLSVGMALFIRDLVLSKKFINQLKPASKLFQGNQHIRISQHISDAFISGYINPTIWFSQNYLHSDNLNTIISHEKQHILNHDQYWLLIITCIQRLMWFNPLAYFLCYKSRQAIELSCDEACKQALGQNNYQSKLAEIMLNKNQPTKIILHNSINQNKNFNINRIEQLNQEYTMNPLNKIKLSFIATALFTFCLYSLTTIAGNYETSQLNDDEVMIKINWKVTETEAGMLHNTEVNSDIVVNSKDFKLFEISDYKINVKAQLANKGSEPKAYLISTNIIGEANSSVSEPAIMVIAGKTATIRMVDSESIDEVKPQIELNFTIPNNKTSSITTPHVNSNPIAQTPPIMPEPITTNNPVQPPQPTAQSAPTVPISAPSPDVPQLAPKPMIPPMPPKADLTREN